MRETIDSNEPTVTEQTGGVVIIPPQQKPVTAMIAGIAHEAGRQVNDLIWSKGEQIEGAFAGKEIKLGVKITLEGTNPTIVKTELSFVALKITETAMGEVYADQEKLFDGGN